MEREKERREGEIERNNKRERERGNKKERGKKEKKAEFSNGRGRPNSVIHSEKKNKAGKENSNIKMTRR